MKDNRISNIAKELGRRGGEATKARFGKSHFKKISKLGVRERKKKKAK